VVKHFKCFYSTPNAIQTRHNAIHIFSVKLFIC